MIRIISEICTKSHNSFSLSHSIETQTQKSVKDNMDYDIVDDSICARISIKHDLSINFCILWHE